MHTTSSASFERKGEVDLFIVLLLPCPSIDPRRMFNTLSMKKLSDTKH